MAQALDVDINIVTDGMLSGDGKYSRYSERTLYDVQYGLSSTRASFFYVGRILTDTQRTALTTVIGDMVA